MITYEYQYELWSLARKMPSKTEIISIVSFTLTNSRSRLTRLGAVETLTWIKYHLCFGISLRIVLGSRCVITKDHQKMV